jgi:hypothetical protein
MKRLTHGHSRGHLRKRPVSVGRVVLGAHRDPRSRSDLVFQTIQDQEVEQTFGGKGVCARSGIRAST